LKPKDSQAESLDRRDFVRRSLATATFAGFSAAASKLVNPAATAAAHEVTPPQLLGQRDKLLMPHAVFRELQLGSVLPEGWLHQELNKQANGITGHQPDFCFPFDRHYWDSNERGQDQESRNGGIFWYPWEQMGYWTDGAYRCAKLIDDRRLRLLSMEPIRYTVDHPVDGWFLGPRKLFDISAADDPGRWPQAVFFRALAAAAEGENAPDILNAMCRHYLRDTKSDYQHGPYGPRDRVNIESMLWCYAHSGEQRLLDKAQDVWSRVPPADLAQMIEDKPSRKHGVTFAEVSKLAALLYMYTGDARQLEISEAATRRVFKYHMLVDGTPSTTEGLRGTGQLDGHETCDVVEFNLTWGYLAMATGAGEYADRIERALFNAGMGSVRKDWSGLQYISCPNQVHIARNSCQPGHKGTAAALYGPSSDHRPEYPFITACCAGNISRMLPTYVQRMWMSAGDGGLAALLYGPSRVLTTVGKQRQPIEIIEETSYPFSEEMSFRIRSARPVEFPLHLRVPAWCKQPKLSVNGRREILPPINNGFVVLHRNYAGGDVIRLELPMKAELGHSTDGGIHLERGPLVYCLRPKENWTSIAMPEFEITSPEFPMWAAAAGSPWNFALVIDPELPLDSQVRVNKAPAGAAPWETPPISLSVSARRVTGWDLLHPKGDDPNWFLTPPLPPPESPLGPEERVNLVPVGSSHLRLTVFPQAALDKRST
jgi:uncharacterized protein